MMDARQIPNVITLLRFGLTIPILFCIYHDKLDIALILFAMAGLSDGIDGYLARRYDWSTRLGSILDPAADKFLMLSTLLVLAYKGSLPWWLVAIILFRDLIVSGGALVYHYLIGPYKFTPSITSKINTFFQLSFIVMVLFIQSFPNLFNLLQLPVSLLMYYIVPTTNVVSLIHYVVIWSRKAIRRERFE